MKKRLEAAGVFQFESLPVGEIPFSEAVTAACAANRCGKYATCWTCPPGLDPQKAKERIQAYQTAWVFTCKYNLEDSFDFEGMRAGGHATHKKLLALTDDLHRDGIDFMALGCEGCILCEACTYPHAPCRFPERAIPSVEACGIDVVALSRRVGINYHNGPNTVTYFCVILRNEK
ncbi:MAG: DUF2284 domain-containing protein [Clostridia bacterium]|nr:DUF2284 domain-containing protein [Clostridia bacterium]